MRNGTPADRIPPPPAHSRFASPVVLLQGFAVITVGIDLSAEPKKTAIATIRWQHDTAVVTGLDLNCTDTKIIESIIASDKTGIDCPLGWPDAFVDFVHEHRDGAVTVPSGMSGKEWRRELTLRVTDLAVQRDTAITPMRVSADLIAHPAMRCAGLLSQLADQGYPVDRAGTGPLAEVYPAATLKLWGFAYTKYKRDESIRAELITSLTRAAPWFDLADFADLCQQSDDALDAVVASLAARAVALGLTTTPPPEHLATAQREGWIALPTGPLAALDPQT